MINKSTSSLNREIILKIYKNPNNYGPKLQYKKTDISIIKLFYKRHIYAYDDMLRVAFRIYCSLSILGRGIPHLWLSFRFSSP